MTTPPLSFGTDAPLHEIMTTTRAMRRLKPDPVPREQLEQLVQAATYGPSGGNNQSYSFVIVTDREPIARLAPVWRRIVDYYVASQTPPPHVDAESWGRTMAALRYQGDHFEDTPALIIACYDSRGMVERMLRTGREQLAALRSLGPRAGFSLARNMFRAKIASEGASVYPGIQNLLLTARALGLAATMTTWHTFFEQEFKAILGIPAQVGIYAIVPVGKPAGRFGPVTRQPVADAIHWQGW
ncbi:nitroreductase family protein [Nocardia huaxiensis]|uniref:nitroreductase family protein n=1 Tax=Nocardia huaxiensis TaxID=2755382 RepID=UPI001E638569|nr:nitroreductase family protein [Nocardia huaxiensis]UFS97570.1 nitroreductase family protein [Nocardia huaxiensis]